MPSYNDYLEMLKRGERPIVGNASIAPLAQMRPGEGVAMSSTGRMAGTTNAYRNIGMSLTPEERMKPSTGIWTGEAPAPRPPITLQNAPNPAAQQMGGAPMARPQMDLSTPVARPMMSPVTTREIIAAGIPLGATTKIARLQAEKNSRQLQAWKNQEVARQNALAAQQEQQMQQLKNVPGLAQAEAGIVRTEMQTRSQEQIATARNQAQADLAKMNNDADIEKQRQKYAFEAENAQNSDERALALEKEKMAMQKQLAIVKSQLAAGGTTTEYTKTAAPEGVTSGTRTVTKANPVAEQMAQGTQAPASTDQDNNGIPDNAVYRNPVNGERINMNTAINWMNKFESLPENDPMRQKFAAQYEIYKKHKSAWLASQTKAQ